MNKTKHHFSERRTSWEWGLLFSILILAACLRLYRLNSVPPGLSHDEASNGHDAAAVLEGIRPIYFSVGYGHEPLYPYSVAFLMSFLGPTETTLRLTTVAWSIALILLSYGLARRLFGPLPALLTAAFMATSFWCVMTSRVGLRAITLGTTFTASALCFWRAFPLCCGDADAPSTGRRWLWPILSGVSLGASIYTYMASRAMPAVYLTFPVYLLLLRWLKAGSSLPSSGYTQVYCGIGILLLTAALVTAPLVCFLIAYPAAEQRIDQLIVPLQEATQGNFRPLWRNISRTLPALTFQGDPMWRYNIAGRPLLGPASATLFYLGLIVCLWQWRDPRHGFLLIWLVIGASPALVAGPDATVLRLIAVQPIVFVLIALGLTSVLDLVKQALQWGDVLGIAVVVVLIAATTLSTVRSYFNVWAEHPEVRTTYYYALVQQARYLDAQPESGTVALSSIYPGRFHDPYTMEMALRRDDLTLHWFDGRFALVFPPEKEIRVIIPTVASLDETLEPTFQEYATLVHAEHFRPDDSSSRFDVYRFSADEALAGSLEAAGANLVYSSDSTVFPATAPGATYERLTLPVDLNGVIELIGYDLLTPSVVPGKNVELLTFWRVQSVFASEAVMFAHLLDGEGFVVGQIDRLDVPSYHWRPGDAFAQLHRFSVNAGTPDGLYHLQIGIYTREDLARLPVLVNGAVVDDRVLLSPVEVAGP